MILIKRGEVWWIDFNHSIGGETQKTRPAVVISNERLEKNQTKKTLCKLKSKNGVIAWELEYQKT
jgi:mRNA interferase MazF